MIQRSVLNRLRTWSGTRTRLKKKEKSANVQRETFRDLQKARRIDTQDHFKILRKSGFLEEKYEEIRFDLSHSIISLFHFVGCRTFTRQNTSASAKN